MLQRSFQQWPWLVLVGIAACGGRDNPSTFVARDSSGVAILSYPASAWDSTPKWTLSEKPLLTLGGDSLDATMDLSTALAATILDDGHVVLSTSNPAELLLFDTTGHRIARLGAPGTGSGEYRAVTQLLQLGNDTVFAYDATQGKGLFFAANGMAIGERIMPSPTSPVPLLLRGRVNDGTFVFSLDMVSDSSPTGPPKPFRNRFFVLGLNPRTDRYDTLATGRGAEMVPGMVNIGGQVTSMAKPLIFGASTQVVVGSAQWYLTSGDRFEVEGHDARGKLLRVMRIGTPVRPVGGADQERYKATVREAYDRVKGMVPPEVFATEMKKLDETTFADHFPAVAQILTDRKGNLWVNRGFSLVDKFRNWAVFGPDGKLIGQVETPIGSVLAISGNRVLIRREDVVTRRVGLEVYSLHPATGASTPAGDSTKR